MSIQSTSSEPLCPKCGKPLGSGVSRCWNKPCDYVIPGTIVTTQTTLTDLNAMRRKLRELNDYWAETSEIRKLDRRIINLKFPVGAKQTDERTEIALMLINAKDHTLKKRAWLVQNLEIHTGQKTHHLIENGIVDIEFTDIGMTVNNHKKERHPAS